MFEENCYAAVVENVGVIHNFVDVVTGGVETFLLAKIVPSTLYVPPGFKLLKNMSLVEEPILRILGCKVRIKPRQDLEDKLVMISDHVDNSPVWSFNFREQECVPQEKSCGEP